MLEDFQQDKNEQPLDPLSDGPSLSLGKKVGLICAAVALVGLFMFFTSDSWSSDAKNATNQEALAQDVEQLKARVTEVEHQIHNQGLTAFSTAAAPDQSPEGVAPTPEVKTMLPDASLRSALEHELQDVPQVEETEPTAKPAAPQPKKQPAKADAGRQTYTVKKGDSLSKISQKFYGSPNKWKRIVEANKDKLGHKQVLKAGMTLVIPKE